MTYPYYSTAQALHVKAADFLWMLMNASEYDMEEVEKALIEDAHTYLGPCYAKRMKLEMAKLIRKAKDRP